LSHEQAGAFFSWRKRLNAATPEFSTLVICRRVVVQPLGCSWQDSVLDITFLHSVVRKYEVEVMFAFAMNLHIPYIFAIGLGKEQIFFSLVQS